jgi:predicted nucleic acid-binding protein
VNTYVVDASIAVKWVVEESGTQDALALLKSGKLIAPDLLVAECANILWKKVQRDELSKDEALLAARLIERAEIEFVPTRPLLESATRIAIDLDHPAYDCLYLFLAVKNDCRFVTADERFLRKMEQGRESLLRSRVIAVTGWIDGRHGPKTNGT